MKIPTKGRYAVSAILNLAIHENIGPVTIADIAEDQNISLSYLEQLFARLRRAGLVEGTRGPGGGYRLGRSADTITIADIIAAVDEQMLDAPLEGTEYLPYVLWADLSKRFYEYLRGITVAECINRPEVGEFVKARMTDKPTDTRRKIVVA